MVMPAIAPSVLIGVPRVFDDWINWGKGAKSHEITVLRGLNVMIGDDMATYYGEWQI